MPSDAPEEIQELHRAAVMFPKLFLWVIGALMSLLTLLGGVVVTGLVRAGEAVKQKQETHDVQMSDHDARLRLLEQSQRDLKDTTKDTNGDVKEIRRLIEEQMRHQNNSAKRSAP